MSRLNRPLRSRLGYGDRGHAYEGNALFEALRDRRGQAVATEIATMADRARAAAFRNHRPLPVAAAYRWAEERYDERQRDLSLETGYDPDDEHRWLPTKDDAR